MESLPSPSSCILILVYVLLIHDFALDELAECIVTQFDSVVADYVDVRKWPVIGPIAKWALRATTAGVLVGVYQFNTNDIGEPFIYKKGNPC